MSLSICIPTMKRWWSLKDSLPLMLEEDCVGEVIVCDETGEDISAIESSSLAGYSKLRLVRNERRLGIYENKKKVLRLATRPWAALLDSDNQFPEEWFLKVRELISKPPSNTIYGSAEFQTVNLDTGVVERPCEDFVGESINRASWPSIFREGDSRPWHALLNDGNWILPSAAGACLPDSVRSEELLAVDALFMVKIWVEKGYTIEYPEGLSYIHTIHKGSSWLATEAESTAIMRKIDWSRLAAPA
jgi:glycosyltransferase involved in cell wall biosynthesis